MIPKCFNCFKCGQNMLGKKFRSKDNRPYCKDDYQDLFGLKCGGTLEQRAERLFMLKNTARSKLPKHIFAKKSKQKKAKK